MMWIAGGGVLLLYIVLSVESAYRTHVLKQNWNQIVITVLFSAKLTEEQYQKIMEKGFHLLKFPSPWNPLRWKSFTCTDTRLFDLILRKAEMR